MKMFVWNDLPDLADWSNGLLCVIAASKEEAIDLGVDAFCGTSTHVSWKPRRDQFRVQLAAREPEIITRGAAYTLGGS